MEHAIKVINKLQTERIIDQYAIGGAVALLFHAEPVLTYDLDVFVFIEPASGGLLVLSPIYDRLREMGYKTRAEHVLIEDLPVQFIPAYNDLVVEAVRKAVDVKVGNTKTRVIQADHLAAIMLQTGRRKDRERLALLMEEATVNRRRLAGIVSRHGLDKRWRDFQK